MTTAAIKKEIAALEAQKKLLTRLRALRMEVNDLRIQSLGSTDDARVITALSAEVCRQFNLDQAMLLGKSRERSVIVPRFALNWLAYHVAKLNLSAIARVLGCDHGTVSNAIKGCQDMMDTRDDFRATMTTLKQRCQPRVVIIESAPSVPLDPSVL